MQADSFVQVLLPVSPNGGIFTYAVPASLHPFVEPGKRVLVPFHTNRLLTGIVLKNQASIPEGIRIRRVEDVLDEKPLLSKKVLVFWEWMAAYYCCSQGEVLASALPSVLRIESETTLVYNNQFNEEEHPGVWEMLSDADKVLVNQLRLKPEGESLQEVRKKLGSRNLGNLLASGIVLAREAVEDKFKPLLEKYVRILFNWEDKEFVSDLFSKLEKKSPKQLEVILLMAALRPQAETHDGWLSCKMLQVKQASQSAIDALVKKQILQQELFESERLPVRGGTAEVPSLSAEQAQALKEIQEQMLHKPVLLYGVTGSGKTEVVSHLALDVLNDGKQVLYLLPEIALTRFLMERLRRYFGDRVLVYHSRISDNERAEIWKKAVEGVPMILVGPRSALLVPMASPGLVVVDEEHDASYKQHEPAPRFHARDAAVYLASTRKIPVILASATPSAESYHNCTTGKYALVELTIRHGGNILPQVVIADMKMSRFSEGPDYLGKELHLALNETLERKEQAILFLNRRGFSVLLECASCSWTPGCINCNVSLTYHKNIHLLKCHYCGFSRVPPLQCESCGREAMQTRGTGTEKIEEELSLMYPAHQVARLDLDTARSRFSFNQLLQSFSNGETSILVGTQMLSKGLDFRNVSLAGIVNADALLAYPDFRASERAWQLMVQVSGRSGRFLSHGRVVIQTRRPENPFFYWIQNPEQYKGFLDKLLLERNEYMYPPFARLIEITVKHKQQEAAAAAARNFADELLKLLPLPLLGPEPPPVNRIRQFFLYRILIKADKSFPAAVLKTKLLEAVRKTEDAWNDRHLRIILDIDPY